MYSHSEDEGPSPSANAASSTLPSAHIRRAGSAAAATLASLTRSIGSDAHGYSRVNQQAEGEEEEEEDVIGSSGGGKTEGPGHHGQDKSNDSENDLEIHVRFGEGQDLSLRVPRTDTITQVKEKVKEARPSIGDKYLRLIHAGKILMDNKTLIDSLPKSLFAQIEVPHQQQHHLQSRLSSSVEAVEAAASHLLAGISSRTSGEKSALRTHTSLGSILPTHLSYTPSTHASVGLDNSSNSNTIAHPLAAVVAEDNQQRHVTISIPGEQHSSSHDTNNNTDNNSPNNHSGHHTHLTRTMATTTMIPVQTGPIYFLCSLSDYAPAQPPSEVKKGKAKAVAIDTQVSRSSTRSSNRSLRSSQQVPSQSTSAAATAAGLVGAPSSLALSGGSGGRNHEFDNSNSSGIAGTGSSTRQNGTIREEQEDEVDDEGQGEEDGAGGELSPIIPSQPTGFDRLREAGFSEDEIRSIRRQFHASRGTSTTVGENGIAVGLEDQDEDASARARRIEEEWIDQHGAETLPEGLEGSYGEMVWGLMLGFFMGLIVLFWFKEATFSRRQQMGVIAGLMINVGFGVLHLYY
ncbi:hypothetical protein BGZ54_008688 [Gamsiella multidivaricata]|nr:hypothetical protein BGZ54_008688 [Gamsiella multidivaricata]